MNTTKARYEKDIIRLTKLLKSKVDRLHKAPGRRLAEAQGVISIATDLERAIYVVIVAERAIKEGE